MQGLILIQYLTILVRYLYKPHKIYIIMKLSTKGRYAVMALADLAKFDNNNPVSLRDISLRQGNIIILFRTNFFKTKKK